jgi:hypothetical protein
VLRTIAGEIGGRLFLVRVENYNCYILCSGPVSIGHRMHGYLRALE